MSKLPEKLNFDETSNVAVQEQPLTKRPASRPVHAPRPTAPKISDAPLADEEDDGFFARNKVGIILGGVVVAGGVWLGFFREPSEPARPAPVSKPVMVTLPPMPPPTPPPVKPLPTPKIEPPKDLKPVEKAPEEKPVDKPIEKPAEKPPEGLGTNVKGNGPGLAGLGSSGNGMIGGEGRGGGNGTSMAKWYASQFQSRLVAALKEHPKTRRAAGRIELNVWWDASGKVERAQLLSPSGDAEVDQVVTNEIVTRLRGPEAPPKGLKMPVTYRLSFAKRP